jgi:hypothetical protein
MNLTQLLKKYPQYIGNMHNDPKEDCAYCSGKGEVKTEEHGTLPCACIFRDHVEIPSKVTNDHNA